MLIEKDPRKVRTTAVPGAEWVQADACEVSSLEEAQLATCDVVIAATGDDKANLVVSLLAKTEFAVNRVVARVKDPRNEWLYTEAWGVDVAVSTPRVLAALVEEAVTVGDVVRLMSFRKGAANLVEITLAEDTPWVGRPLREVPLPRETVLTAILRGERVITPAPDEPLEAGDELLFVTHGEVEEQLKAACSPRAAQRRAPTPGVTPRGAPGPRGVAGARWRCSRETTHRVTTTSTAVTGRPSTSDDVPSSLTSVLAAQVQHPLDRGAEEERPRPTARSASRRRAASAGPRASAAPARGPACAAARGRARRGARRRPRRRPAAQPGQRVRRPSRPGGWAPGTRRPRRPAASGRGPSRAGPRRSPALRRMPSTKKSRAWPERGRDGHRDADGEQAADRLLDALPAHQPQQEDQHGAPRRRPRCRPQPADAVGDDERDGRQRGVDHAAPAPELVEHQVPVEAIPGPGLRRRRAASGGLRCAAVLRTPSARASRRAVSRRPARTRGCR